jgi:hypothetical protein
LSSTPAGYATPDQLAQANMLTQQVNKGAHRDAPITSPWQGARMMADALTGQKMMQHNSQQEMASRGYDNPQSLQGPGGAPSQMPPGSPPGMLGQQPPPNTAMPPPPPPSSPQAGGAAGGMPMPQPRPPSAPGMPMQPGGMQAPPQTNMAGMPFPSIMS